MLDPVTGGNVYKSYLKGDEIRSMGAAENELRVGHNND